MITSSQAVDKLLSYVPDGSDVDLSQHILLHPDPIKMADTYAFVGQHYDVETHIHISPLDNVVYCRYRGDRMATSEFIKVLILKEMYVMTTINDVVDDIKNATGPTVLKLEITNAQVKESGNWVFDGTFDGVPIQIYRDGSVGEIHSVVVEGDSKTFDQFISWVSAKEGHYYAQNMS